MIAIVAVGYNRPDGIKRLVESLLSAQYDSDTVDLIFSLDKGERQSEILEYANSVDWAYGKKMIRAYNDRQGLRKHIIQCGDLSEFYDAVIIFEDDISVSTYFYHYVKKALAFYKDNAKIAGISLYSHLWYSGPDRPFFPYKNEKDCYLMQYAASWGQCWTKNMWNSFKEWYIKNEQSPFISKNIPLNVKRWEKSWLKFYIRYMIENDLYFIFPYISLATNHSDSGEHCIYNNNSFQVPLLMYDKKYHFGTIAESVCYDAFWERKNLDFSQMFQESRVCMDLYGYKTSFNGFDILLSTALRPFRIIRTIALVYRPHEINCLMPADGKGIFVYDLNTPAKTPKADRMDVIRYDLRATPWREALLFACEGMICGIKSRIKRIIKK